MRGCHMLSCDLSNKTDLSDADFTDSVLFHAKLNDVIAHGTNFSGANLSGSEFNGADFNQANFMGANLVRSKLNGADLSKANLIGADITYTRPWEATLFSRQIVTGISTENLQDLIENIADVISISDKIRNHYQNNLEEECPDKEWNLYFRGEDYSKWSLRPSVMRCEAPNLRENEGYMIRDLMSSRPEEFSGMPSALSQWVIAQHHGLKTRLLDITRNPLVALFSACEKRKSKDGLLHIFAVPSRLIKAFDSDTINIIANFSKLHRFEKDLLLGHNIDDRLNQMGLYGNYRHALARLYGNIGQDNPYFKEDIDPRDLFRVFVVEPQQSFERIRAQAGAFLISAFHERFERENILEWNENIPVYDHYKMIIPANRKSAILRELSLLNMTREVLLPGLDESARAIIKRYS